MNFQSKPYDITDCDREPIHNIAAVQGFGALIIVNADWVISHRSVNCAELLNLDALPKVGVALASLFTPGAMDTLRETTERTGNPDTVERLFGIRCTSSGPPVDCALHRSGQNIIIEFELHAEQDYPDHLAMIGPMLSKLEPIRDPRELFKTTVRLVRDMLGYDRVMVYRFRPDDSGEVIAEDRREDLEPFLGLRYPQSDIPMQARELFVRNRFRVIADMGAEHVPIEPAQALDGTPLDLSMSVLRAHSKMHVQYMQNMGVEASLAISIVRHGKLWGMIACHHHEPRQLPFSLRTVAEMFSQMFSLMLDRLLINQSEQLRSRGKHLHDQLMVRLAGGASLAEDLPMIEAVLGDLIEHDGMSVLIDGEYRAHGAAPAEDQFLAIAPVLGAAPVSEVLAATELGQQIEAASEFADVATGALVLPISRSPRDYLVLWRKPLTQTVTWAGNPAKTFAKGANRLEPRGSFAAWAETVENRCEDWTEDELVIAEGLRISLLEVVLRMTDEVARERKRAHEQQELLIAELNHRVRNILNLIRSLVAQSQDDALSVSNFVTIIGGRIAALASAHDNITRENWTPAPLSALFKTELAAYLTEKQDRFIFDGDEVLIKPEAYTVLALVVHELVTNSAKYGCLCDSHGELKVGVSRNRDGDLEIAWRESGGPPVKPPRRRGFGSTIIERSIPFELRGEAELRFKLSGLEADFVVPSRYVDDLRADKDAQRSAGSSAAPRKSDSERSPAETGLPNHVLVVEDSMIIALDTEENLKRLGIKSIKVESSVAGALRAIENRPPEFAIIDFNLGTESSIPVARELSTRGIRFVIATGYAEIASQLDDLGAAELIRKPYGREDIQKVIAAVTA